MLKNVIFFTLFGKLKRLREAVSTVTRGQDQRAGQRSRSGINVKEKGRWAHANVKLLYF